MIRRTSLLLALLAVTPAAAGPREDVYGASQRCAAITDDRSWLECYYGAAQPMRGQLQLPPAPASQTALIPAPIPGAPAYQPAAPSSALAARTVPPKPGPVSRTLDFLAGGSILVSSAPLKSYQAGKQGTGFTVVLADGQVWQQADDQPRLLRWRNGPEAHKITIWKGAMNSFNLGFDDENDRYKVRRVK
jgi:hypothetical protein